MLNVICHQAGRQALGSGRQKFRIGGLFEIFVEVVLIYALRSIVFIWPGNAPRDLRLFTRECPDVLCWLKTFVRKARGRELYVSDNLMAYNRSRTQFLRQTWIGGLATDSRADSRDVNGAGRVRDGADYLNALRLAAREVKELEFLRSAKNILELDLSNNKLEGRVPDWSNWMFALQHLILSHNMLTSVDSIPFQYVVTIDLRSNVLQGSRPIPPNTTWFFFISQNNLSGKILSSICNSTSLKIRDLVRNNLSGEILQRLGNITALEVLDMRHNILYGNLPRAFSNGRSLRSLNLHGNKLEGKIPRSLANCKELQVLDLRNNHLIDTFPMKLGTLPKLQVLSLRSNELHGSIRTPTVENIFPNLRMLDLSFNAFTENLLTILFHHLKVMRTIDPSKKEPSDGYYQDTEAV
ncbi:putative beta-glucosidase 44-like [Capsicum annuum]|nr:putative beta-glucosidase 44-like [Capsicum annuum]